VQIDSGELQASTYNAALHTKFVPHHYYYYYYYYTQFPQVADSCPQQRSLSGHAVYGVRALGGGDHVGITIVGTDYVTAGLQSIINPDAAASHAEMLLCQKTD